jgi:lipoprotein signal peptidase
MQSRGPKPTIRERVLGIRTPPRPRRSSDRERVDWRPAVAITFAVALLDWTTKALVAVTVPLHGFVEVWEGRLALWHVKNRAMMLGLYESFPLEARKSIALTAALLGVLVLMRIVVRGHRLSAPGRRWAWLFTGFVAGGMLGNLGERALHWGVTDFLSFGWRGIWLPPGNVADLALVLSIPLAVVVMSCELRERRQRRRGSRPTAVGYRDPLPSR